MKLKEIYGPDLIQGRVRELGDRISRDFQNQTLLTVCVLKGAFIFCADLVRCISVKTEMDFVKISSYNDNTFSSGRLKFTRDMETPVQGRNVLIVEDIVDSGRTVSYLMRLLQERGARSVRLCALIDKIERREVEVKVDYAGFVLDEGFIVGYGLDYAEQYRNLPGVFQLVPEE